MKPGVGTSVPGVPTCGASAPGSVAPSSTMATTVVTVATMGSGVGLPLFELVDLLLEGCEALLQLQRGIEDQLVLLK